MPVRRSTVDRDPLPCIVCGYQPEAAFPDEIDRHQPYMATQFSASGNYGSTVFDPILGYTGLEINVCDKCLLERKERVWFIRYRSQPALIEVSKPWDPSAED